MENKKTGLIVGITAALIFVAGLIGVIIGILKTIGLDTNYEKAMIACEDKDYSSYIKTNETVKPGNENINEQIDLLKKAMESATNNNDPAAFGQLYEQYNNLLELQAKTSTTEVSYDYTEANNAKEKCYSLANNQKETNKTKTIILLTCGGIGTTIGLVILIIVLVKMTRAQRPKNDMANIVNH